MRTGVIHIKREKDLVKIGEEVLDGNVSSERYSDLVLD